MPASPTTNQAVNKFDVYRKQAQDRLASDQQQADDALKRRFASLGNLQSGAAIKTAQNQQTEFVKQREQAMQGIDIAEADENQRKQEIKEQRDFEAGENQKQRDFSQQMQKEQFGFQSGEAEKQRGWQGSQSDIDRAFQQKVFSFESAAKLRALDQADQQIKIAQEESKYNQGMAEWQKEHTGGLFGAGGFLGLGF